MPLRVAHLTPARADLLAIMEAALAAVDPRAAVGRALRREGNWLHVESVANPYDLSTFENVWIIGAGKAGAPMAQAAEEVLGEWLRGGVVVVKHDHLAPVARVELREAAHPVPDAAGLQAGEAILALATQAGPRDLVLCLLSGGGSALLEALPEPLTLADLQRTTAAMLASGASIVEVNALRKHLSRVKGGQLARAVAPATLVTLVLSDVVGSPLDTIASGPTVADASTWQEVGEIVARYHLEDVLPPAVFDRVQAGLAGEVPETPNPGDPLFLAAHVVIVGDNAQAAEAAHREAEARGYEALILTTFLEGEAREAARFAVALGREVQAHGRPRRAPACLILGGETTVTLAGEGRTQTVERRPGETKEGERGRGGEGDETENGQLTTDNRQWSMTDESPSSEDGEPDGKSRIGRGGRNQELALAAAVALIGRGGITVGALATDGSDGPTDSAGAMVDGSTVARAAAQRFHAADHLARHDAYPLLDAVGDLLRSGPTNTNVNDLLFVLVEANE